MTSRPTKIDKESIDPFERGEAWRQFLSLESSLRQFVDYVPLNYRNRNVFSPKLGEILISAAIQVEATFKAIIESNYLDNDKIIDRTKLEAARNAIHGGAGNLDRYRSILEPYFMLSKRKVTIRQRPRTYRTTNPFLKFRIGKRPSWWESYNLIKHSFYENIEEATMGRTFSAVAGLFLIHVMHLTHRKTLVDLDVIKSGNREFGLEGFARPALARVVCSSPRRIRKNVEIPAIWAETEFFEFDFYAL